MRLTAAFTTSSVWSACEPAARLRIVNAMAHAFISACLDGCPTIPSKLRNNTTGAGVLVQDEASLDFSAVIRKIRNAPLSVEVFCNFLPPAIRVIGPAVDLKAMGVYMDMVLKRAAEAGASIMVFGSGKARRMPEGFEDVNRVWGQLADAARLAGEIAAKYGIVIAMEPLLKKACNIFNRVDQGAAFVDRVAHPNLKLLADLFHVAAENEPLGDIVAAGSRLAHIHVPVPAIPGTGQGHAYDFKGYFGALKQAGYNGRVSVEDNQGLLRNIDGSRMSAIAAALAFLRKAAG